jgi:phosphate:Na+ symporter
MQLGAVTTDLLINILLAAGLTWAAHSSVTVVLLVMAFAAQAVVPPHAAFALMFQCDDMRGDVGNLTG